MKPQRRRKARSMIAAGRMGRYEVVVGAAHPEEAVKMAKRRECAPTSYRLVSQTRAVMRRSSTSIQNIANAQRKASAS